MEVVSESVDLARGEEKMRCHLSQPASGGPYPALVVAMEAWGLNDQIKRMADRFASEGFVAIVPDLYFRQPDNVVSYNDLAKAFRLMATIRDDDFVADVSTAIQYLEGRADVVAKFGTVGFCLGGSVAFVSACRIPEVTATVPFYGAGLLWQPHPEEKSRAEYVPGLKAAVLSFFGGKDAFIPAAEVSRFRDALKAASKQFELILYPDADHGFMNEERPSYHPRHAAEAWEHTIAFFKTHLI
ncbi:MAG TPA: dienelactone hydrolase family protein [Candidatus Binataceae bacterium]|nr:dienelactone hydrolase family protein [Candidatus Binataceae bacterium]